MVFTNLIVENSEQMHWRNSFFLLELYMENWQLLLKWIPSQLPAKYLDRKFKEIYYHAIVFQQVFEYSDAYNIWKRISEILRLSFLTLCDKWKFPFKILRVNVHKFSILRGFGHICCIDMPGKTFLWALKKLRKIKNLSRNSSFQIKLFYWSL